MRVDAEHGLLAQHFLDLSDYSRHFVRKGAAVRVTQNESCRSRVSRNRQHLHSVFPILLVTVKEVLSVEEHLSTFGFEVVDRIGNHRQVFFQRRLKHYANVPRRCLTDQGEDLCA